MTEQGTYPLERPRSGLRLEASTGHLRQGHARLRVTSGPMAGQERPLETRLTVGTDDVCELALKDKAVSRRHAQLTLIGEEVRIVDLRSTNGTWIRGLQVGEATVDLAQPVTLKVGETTLSLSFEDEDLGAPSPRERFGEVQGTSARMRQVFGLLDRVAPTDTAILLLGETGTGKDALARAVHEASRRRGPLVVFDCGAVSADLIESDLFGHVRGAFSGATADRRGVVAQAERGTLFIDEIGELALELQPRLLRVLETRTVTPVGGTSSRPIDVRFVAATHRDLEAEVRAGRFRADLFFRLSVVPIAVPPLRERLDDLVPLALAFAAQRGAHLDLPRELEERMRAYTWPGNVRELRNFVERALAGLPPTLEHGDVASSATDLPFKEAKERLFESFTREYLQQLSTHHDGNVTHMAKAAGLARPHLHRLMKRYGL